MSDASGVKPKADEPQAENKGRRKLVLVAVLGAGVLAGGAGAGWYFMRSSDDDAHVEARHRSTPVFAPLEPFTVNLADEDGDRVAQVAVVLELTDSKSSDTIKALMPAVRNGILLLLSAKRSDELLTRAGKERLAGEIAVVTGTHLGWRAPAPEPANAADAESAKGPRPVALQQRPSATPNPVTAVHFSQFLVQ